MSNRLEITITREGNNILGNFYRVIAYRGDYRLGEQIYAGYTRRESERRARDTIRERGRLGI